MQFNLGNSPVNAGRADEAIAAAKRSLAMSPRRTAAHYVIGISLLLKHDAGGALAEFQAEPSDVFQAIGRRWRSMHLTGRQNPTRHYAR